MLNLNIITGESVLQIQSLINLNQDLNNYVKHLTAIIVLSQTYIFIAPGVDTTSTPASKYPSVSGPDVGFRQAINYTRGVVSGWR